MELYEYAQKLSKTCIDLCPDSFEPWYYYAMASFGIGDTKAAVCAIDMSPLLDDIKPLSLPQRLKLNL